MKSISVQELDAALKTPSKKILLVDVRTPMEYQAEHIPQAKNIPLDQIESAFDDLKGYERVYVQCQSGNRSSQACQKLEAAQLDNMMNVQGGIAAWKDAGFVTTKGKGSTISLFRQVQIAAGSLILLGVGLFYWGDPRFIWLTAFVGAGLLFAGVTGTCAMGTLLSKMPWNR